MVVEILGRSWGDLLEFSTGFTKVLPYGADDTPRIFTVEAMISTGSTRPRHGISAGSPQRCGERSVDTPRGSVACDLEQHGPARKLCGPGAPVDAVEYEEVRARFEREIPKT
jgi:hypothetical protein